jgi:hypothetical protein
MEPTPRMRQVILVSAHSRTALRAWPRALAAAVLALAVLVVPSMALAATFNPANVISDDNMRDRFSMSSAADVQAFLEAVNPAPSTAGALKNLVTADHGGVRKSAATIIWDACRYYGISPRVMLVMLQKEQSLLTRTAPAARTLERAVGAGCPDAKANRYPGFGPQIWNGARLLDGYGEGRVTYIPIWQPGMSVGVYGGLRVVPANLASFKLFTYNPSIGAKAPYGDLSGQECSGNANFWKIYWKYFGDPQAAPRYRPVYRFRAKRGGVYLFVTSDAERIRVGKSGTWSYQGVALSVDTSSPANVSSLYRLYNRSTGAYFYTASIGEMNSVIRRSGRAYRLDRTLCKVSVTATGKPVYRLYRKGTPVVLITSDRRERDSLVRAGFRYDRIICWLGN